jgi:hypothetical protein
MSKSIDLKTIESRAFLSYHEDGLVDLFVGATMFLLALMIWCLPEFWIFLIGGFVALMSSYAAAKKSITVPRMGYVEFSQTRRRRIQYILLVFMVVLVFANILSIFAWIFPPLGILIFESGFTILLLGIVGAILLACVGYFSSIKRFIGYGGVLLVSTVITFFVPLLLVLPLLVLGLVMIAYGSFLLIRFTRSYPKNEPGEMEGV